MISDDWQKKLERFKEKIQRDSDLAQLGHDFMGEFGDCEEFIGLSKPTRSPITEQLAIAALKEGRRQADIDLHSLMLMRPEGTDFVHGAFMLDGQIAMILFFEDVKMGLIILENHQIRLTGFEVGSGPLPN